jgi:flagellar basal-body rod protein FlgB
MSPIFPNVIDQISASMTASSLEHQKIVSNIANRDTPGYQRMKLQFDRAMDKTSGSARTDLGATGTTVSLEQDLVSLSSNAMQFQALARVVSRYFSITAVITGQGRG